MNKKAQAAVERFAELTRQYYALPHDAPQAEREALADRKEKARLKMRLASGPIVEEEDL